MKSLKQKTTKKHTKKQKPTKKNVKDILTKGMVFA